MLSGVSFSGKRGTKINDRLGQKGLFKPKGFNHSPVSAYPDTKGTHSPHTHCGRAPAVRQHDFRPCCSACTHLQQQLLPLQLLPMFLLDHKDLKKFLWQEYYFKKKAEAKYGL